MGSINKGQMDILIQARNTALEKVEIYPQLMPQVLGMVTATPKLELRRWAAAFIAEALASPTLDQQEKENMSLPLLDTLKSFLELPDHDTPTLKSTIQACASVYPLIFRHIIHNPNDEATWNRMLAVKSIILRNFDNYPPGVRICCVKFLQCIVQAQTHGVIADPRKSEQNEISLALVPRNHPLLLSSDLEAETSGLLDRLLGILQDKTRYISTCA
jgi:symplekin